MCKLCQVDFFPVLQPKCRYVLRLITESIKRISSTTHAIVLSQVRKNAFVKSTRRSNQRAKEFSSSHVVPLYASKMLILIQST